MQTNRVLLAHRDQSVRELAERALLRVGATLDIADSDVALSLVAREAYKVIVLEHDEAVIAAVATACAGGAPRPVVIVTAPDARELDPNVVSLVMPEPYDAHTLVGVILACVTPAAGAADAMPGSELLHNL
jgi:DNA-binding response OmpR family regulator